MFNKENPEKVVLFFFRNKHREGYDEMEFNFPKSVTCILFIQFWRLEILQLTVHGFNWQMLESIASRN